jgi:hypothetical protein
VRALESDEIFVDFITGNHDAFVIEDADHLLKARSNGNVDLQRFLAVADGVVRAPLFDGTHSGAGSTRGSIVIDADCRARAAKQAGKCSGVGTGYALREGCAFVSQSTKYSVGRAKAFRFQYYQS